MCGITSWLSVFYSETSRPELSSDTLIKSASINVTLKKKHIVKSPKYIVFVIVILERVSISNPRK